MVEVFSLLAVGTSVIGTLLGFSEFFKEQLNNQVCKSETSLTYILRVISFLTLRCNLFLKNQCFSRRFIVFASMAIVVVPSLLVSATVPDAFSSATDIAVSLKTKMLFL